jgi:hypothetical protein
MRVISNTSDVFTVEKVGFTTFDTRRDRIPISWGLDDLIFARIKSIDAAGVRRMAVTGEAIERCNHPKAFWQQGDSPGDVIRRHDGMQALSCHYPKDRTASQHEYSAYRHRRRQSQHFGSTLVFA